MINSFPEWLDREAWSGFCDMRKAAKKPFTPRAAMMVLKELYRIREAGHCPNAALDQSTLHGWLDVYVPKEKSIERKASVQTSEWMREMEAAKFASQTPASQAAREKVRQLFRRA